MFEHMGRHRLGDYFRIVSCLLAEDGLFMNSGITRPQTVSDDSETYFLRSEVFPGGELAHLSNILRDAENAGFEVLELESIRRHYARTCREWLTRLQQNAQACIDLVGEHTWRTWVLYLAASVVNFEDGQIGCGLHLMPVRPIV
jgi:cyclopropane-fatty-acyl-phospholipid synthase